MNQNLVVGSDIYRAVKPTSEIVVVDDDENMRDLLAATLAPEGFPITMFEDGDTFLTDAGTRVPMCIFLDVVMPRRSGLEVLKELRARNYWAPIILTSAMDDIATVVEAMKHGAHDYIRKPFDLSVPPLQARKAMAAWSSREQATSLMGLRDSEDGKWFLLTPDERDAVMMMRFMDIAANR